MLHQQARRRTAGGLIDYQPNKISLWARRARAICQPAAGRQFIQGKAKGGHAAAQAR
jgi:hypothetical protein